MVTHYLHKALMCFDLKEMLAKATYLAVEDVASQSLVLENIHVFHTCQKEEGEEKEVPVALKVL